MMRNSDHRYGLAARFLHWSTALCFVAAYASVYYRHWFTEWRTLPNMSALQLHLSFGVSIAVLTALRIVWMLMDRRPQPEPGGIVAQLAARLSHAGLYAILVVMPVTGYLGSSVATDLFFLVDLPRFQDTALFDRYVRHGLGMSFDEWEVALDAVHKNAGAYLVWPFVAGHVAAALYHHYALKDRTLVRMVG